MHPKSFLGGLFDESSDNIGLLLCNVSLAVSATFSSLTHLRPDETDAGDS